MNSLSSLSVQAPPNHELRRPFLAVVVGIEPRRAPFRWPMARTIVVETRLFESGGHYAAWRQRACTRVAA